MGLSRPLLLRTSLFPHRTCCTRSLVCPSTPYPQRVQPSTRVRFGLFPFRSPLLRESLLFSFPRGTKMFQFPRLLIHAYVFSMDWLGFPPAGLPHSGIPGSSPACGYPRLFAACHALLQPPTPRHPPYALPSLRLASRLRLVSSQHTKASARLSYLDILLSRFFWWRRADSNRRPPACKAGALPAELLPHFLIKMWEVLFHTSHSPFGGPRWVRTTDLTLIRRAL